MSALVLAAAAGSAVVESGPSLPASFYIDWAVYLLSWAFIVSGSFFVLVGSVGLLRMPDVITRMHAASVIDTVGAGFLIAGMMLQAGATLITLKLLFIFVLFFVVSPVATHALAQAALHAEQRPELKHDRTGEAGNQTDQPERP